MSEPRDLPDHDVPTLDDVLEPTESAPHDRQGHGKQPPRLNDDDLQRRVEQERIELGVHDFDPNEIPSATE
jgi:hypothetical protein